MIMSNRFIYFFTVILLSSCSYKSDKDIFANEINSVVDSLPNNYKKLITIQYQEKLGRSFIKISTAEFFNKHSVSFARMYKDNLVIYYKGEFPGRKVNEVNLSKYKHKIYEENTSIIFHPEYHIFEIYQDGKLKEIKNEETYNLFQYGDRYVPEPKPPALRSL